MKLVSKASIPVAIAAAALVWSSGLAAATPVSTAPAASTAWTVVPSPNPPGTDYSELTAVSCVSASVCVAVGTSQATGYSMFAERWSGSSWSIQQVPTASATAATTGMLSDVSCTSATWCTAVGYLNEASGATEPLAATWNGTAWTTKTLPEPGISTGSVLNAVACTSKTACKAVGYSDVNPLGDYVTLAETWNGRAWTVQQVPSPTKASQLLGIACSSGSACEAVGSTQTPPPAGPRAGSETLAEAWNGSTWAVQKTPPLSSSKFGQLAGVSCPVAGSCTAVGYSGLPGAAVPLADVWNGSTWTPSATPSVSGAQATQLANVSCTSPAACTTVGSTAFSASIQTLVETWNGSSWAIEATPHPAVNALAWVACGGPSSCVAVGYSYDASTDSYSTLVEAD